MRRLALLALLLLLAFAGCGGSDEPRRLTVFAASSLSDVLPQLDPAARYSFAGSDELAAQIKEGATADLFLSASPRYVDELVGEGLARDPRVFAHNTLVLVVPAGNPAEIRTVDDLRRAGVRLVLAGEGVPIGDYARSLLAELGASDALRQVVSDEEDARGVLAKVSLGEADAGIVYATDAKAAGDRVETLALPAKAQPKIDYVVARVSGGHEAAAQVFIDRLLGEEGRAALVQSGFALP